MRRFIVLTVLAAAVVLGRAPDPAGACSCVPPELLDRTESADVVFTGERVEVDQSRASGDTWSSGARVLHRFVVDRVYQGDVGPDVVVASASSSVSCGYEFEASRYLVYASRVEGGDLLTTGLCSGNEPLAEGADPAGLGAGRPPDRDVAPDPPSEETAARPTPIGGPEGDVIEPSALDRFGPALAVVGGVVALGLGGAWVLARRRRSA